MHDYFDFQSVVIYDHEAFYSESDSFKFDPFDSTETPDLAETDTNHRSKLTLHKLGKELINKTFRTLKCAESLWVYPVIDFLKMSSLNEIEEDSGHKVNKLYIIHTEFLAAPDANSFFKLVIRKYPERLLKAYKSLESQEIERITKRRLP